MAWRANVDQSTYSLNDSSDCAYVIISQEGTADGGYFIFRFNSKDEVLFGDDYCFTIEEAKQFCQWFYQIDENAIWHVCPNPDWSSIEAAHATG